MARTIKDREFEKNRREILKQTKNNLKNKNSNVNKKNSNDSSQRYAWEYEIEIYKEQKKKERFFTIGAWCGIISLLFSIIINYKLIFSLLSFK